MLVGTTVWLDAETRETLRRLQAALGTASVNETIRRLIEQPASDAHSIFSKHHDAIRKIMRRHKLRDLVAFGSRARGDATPASDLDLAATVGEGASPLAILAAEADLEAELGIAVNLVELPNAALKNVIRREGVSFGR